MDTDVVRQTSEAELVLPPTGAGVEAERIGRIACVRYDIDHAWATQAKVMHPVDPDELDRALEWMGKRADEWTVTTREVYVDDPVFADRGLRPIDGATLELVCMRLSDLDELASAPAVPELTIEPATDPDEFLSVYGTELAPLVAPQLFADPRRNYLVGRLDGVAVACARVDVLARTAYVSGVTVRPDWRHRGFGTAISAAAARRGLASRRVVWLTAVDELGPLYTALGFRPVDVHVQLYGPRTRTA